MKKVVFPVLSLLPLLASVAAFGAQEPGTACFFQGWPSLIGNYYCELPWNKKVLATRPDGDVNKYVSCGRSKTGRPALRCNPLVFGQGKTGSAEQVGTLVPARPATAGEIEDEVEPPMILVTADPQNGICVAVHNRLELASACYEAVKRSLAENILRIKRDRANLLNFRQYHSDATTFCASHPPQYLGGPHETNLLLREQSGLCTGYPDEGFPGNGLLFLTAIHNQLF